MKQLLLAGLSAVVLLTSCSTTKNPGPSDPSPQPYPSPNDPSYPNPGGSDQSKTYPYPKEGERDGNVVIIEDGRDANGNYENLPPGQAKKKYGGKSAKVYAPGQRKKNGEAYNGAPTVISVNDNLASRSTSGQLYYNYRGNTYWKQNDGNYHLQSNSKYSKDKKDKKEKSKKKNHKNKKDRDDDDD